MFKARTRHPHGLDGFIEMFQHRKGNPSEKAETKRLLEEETRIVLVWVKEDFKQFFPKSDSIEAEKLRRWVAVGCGSLWTFIGVEKLGSLIVVVEQPHLATLEKERVQASLEDLGYHAKKTIEILGLRELEVQGAGTIAEQIRQQAVESGQV